MTKLEIAINCLENVFTEQKTRAKQIIVDHKQLQNKLSMIKHLMKYPDINDSNWILKEIKKILKEDEKQN